MSKKNVPPSYKWELIGLLWLAFFLHQGDRQIFNVLIPLIREDLGLSDVQLGLVATIFTLVYGFLVPVAGYAGDIFRRKWIIVASLLIFSVGTMLTGLGSGMVMLILFRSIATGGGEAFYYPAANSLLGQFHHKTRAMAMAIHQTALYVGIVASSFLAGYVGEKYGWRVAFLSFGILGIFWSFVIILRMRDTPQEVSAKAEAAARPPLGEVLRQVFARRTVWALCIAFGAMVYVNIGFLTWMPTYLHERFSLSLGSAGFNSMIYHNALAFVGVLLGGRLSDMLAQRWRKTRMAFGMFGLLAGAPFIWWMGSADSLLGVYTALALFGFFRGVYDSNLFAALFDVVEPQYRSLSVGIMLCSAFVVGAFASLVLGWMKTRWGLSFGLSSLSLFYVFGGLVLLVGMYASFDRDYIADDQQS